MSTTHKIKPALFGLAAAVAGAVMFAAVDAPDGSDAGFAAISPSQLSDIIVVAGNTRRPPPPRLTYQQAKRLGFVKPSNP